MLVVAGRVDLLVEKHDNRIVISWWASFLLDKDVILIKMNQRCLNDS
jgi:hypothetical protein